MTGAPSISPQLHSSLLSAPSRRWKRSRRQRCWGRSRCTRGSKGHLGPVCWTGGGKRKGGTKEGREGGREEEEGKRDEERDGQIVRGGMDADEVVDLYHVQTMVVAVL